MAGAASCSSSSADPFSKKLYDVFISFRGEDTCRNFTALLHAAISRIHIKTWQDNIDIQKGDKVWPALVHAIENSYLCIVVFSKHYASSTRCLKELTHILECKEEKQVIPVFYQIDPSHIRKQSGTYKDAFDKHEKNFELHEETIMKWKDALKNAANLSGFDSESKEYRDETQLIENIAKYVWNKVRRFYLYDVFISFRGEDTRRNFTALLHAAISRIHIKTWQDNTDIQKGDNVWPALVHAIENSYLCIVLFSKHYASSTWCLKELTHILECKEEKQVIPVFYQIDPSHIRNQIESYKVAFDEHEKNCELDEKTIKKWKEALKNVANLSGFDSESKEYGDDHQLIENIVRVVWQKLLHIYPQDEPETLVGADKILADMDLLLKKFQSIGLWGMGGIGKTTVAAVVFNRYCSQYDGHCFLENVKENSRRLELGLRGLRKKLWSELFKGENIYIDAESNFVKSRLSYKSVFIVLDDVDTPNQIEYLVGKVNYFGPGSKIIITTRNKHLLDGRVDKIHKVERLNYQESLQLLCLKAFDRDLPQLGFEELSKRVVYYTQGLPLALDVLGSFLRSTGKEVWEDALKRFKKYPHEPIVEVLKLSYDGLQYEEKRIFLDIAFFLKGERKEDVEQLLNACNFCATIGLETLQNKALITVSNWGIIEMHGLIQEMGWQIVREECTNDPGRRSRLRDPNEVCNVLKKDTGSDAIEGMILNLSQIEELHLSGDVFKKMTQLRFLKFYFPNFKYDNPSIPKVYPSGSESFSDSLKYFYWDAYPLESLPPTLCLNKLVKLHTRGSQV